MAGRDIKKPYSDKRWSEDIGGCVVICSACKHREEYDLDKEVVICDAFPDGIPRDILATLSEDRDLDRECNKGIKFEWDGSHYD